jgi:hypothetical protein
MHPEVASNEPGIGPKCGTEEQMHGQAGKHFQHDTNLPKNRKHPANNGRIIGKYGYIII